MPPSLPLKLHRILYRFVHRMIEQIQQTEDADGSSASDSPSNTAAVRNISSATVRRALDQITPVRSARDAGSIPDAPSPSDSSPSGSEKYFGSSDSTTDDELAMIIGNHIEILSDSSTEAESSDPLPDARASYTPEMDGGCIVISDSDERASPTTAPTPSPGGLPSPEKEPSILIESHCGWVRPEPLLTGSARLSVLTQGSPSEYLSSQGSASPQPSEVASLSPPAISPGVPCLPLLRTLDDPSPDDAVFLENDPVLALLKRKLSASVRIPLESDLHSEDIGEPPSPPEDAPINPLDRIHLKKPRFLRPAPDASASSSDDSTEADLGAEDPEEQQEMLYDALYIDKYFRRDSP